MADPFTIGATIFKGVSVLGGLFGASDAEKRAKRQAKEEARIEREITDERLRQIDKEQEVLRGETIGRAAGSGVKVNQGSPLEVLAEQAYEFQRERQITEKVGASKANTALARGNELASQIRYSGYSSALTGLGSVFSMISDMGDG